MKIKVLIVEDERLVAEDISEYLTEKGMEVVGIVSSSEECFSKISNVAPDVLLMDIRLQGKLNGVEIATIISQTSKIPLIFITANQDEHTLQEVIMTNPSAFISKPFNLTDIRMAIELAYFRKIDQPFESVQMIGSVPAFFVKQGMIYKKINIPDVIYIEADGSYSNIYTHNGTYTVTMNLTTFSNQIRNPLLQRIHRSYIINIDHVDGFDVNMVMIGGKEIPISKQHQKGIQAFFPKL